MEVALSYLHWISLLAQTKGGGGGSAAPGCAGGGLGQLIPMLLMFVVFYFLLIRPQQKKAREHREMLSNLSRGDMVITNGGMLGKVTGLTDKTITLEVAEKIRLRVLRSHILGKQSEFESSSSQSK
jgi:preprotein translocase subunit YajC